MSTNQTSYHSFFLFSVSIPDVRSTIKKYWQDLSYSDIKSLMAHPCHEIRSAGCLSLVRKYETTKELSNCHFVVTSVTFQTLCSRSK